MTAMTRYFRRFVRDTRGATAFETVLLTPLLVWAFVGSFVFFDAYRVYNTSVKTTYMVADMLSRQTSMVYGHDIQGMANVANSIIRGASEVEMRVTQIGMVAGNYQVDWSYGVNGAARIFNANIEAIEDRLPVMPNGERVVLVETFVDYQAPFDIGLTVVRFDSFTLSRPRYAGQIPFDPDGTPPTS